jgi:hypothetical protein
MHNVKNDGEKMYFAHFRALGKTNKVSFFTKTALQYFCTGLALKICSKGPKKIIKELSFL